MEQESWNLKVKDYNISTYTHYFNELALLCPIMVETKHKKIEAYIYGLSENIKGVVTLSKSDNINEAVRMAHALMEKKGAHQKSLPKRNNQQTRHAQGWAYVIKEDQNQGPNVVTGTFLLNNHYASVSFDSGSDKSFVSTNFSTMININPVRLNTSYEVELADGKIVSTNTVLKGCTINLVNHLFEIDLRLIKLRTFDVIIGIDWFFECDAVIVCGKKVIRIPYRNKTLIVKGDIGESRLKEPAYKRLKDVSVIHDFPKVLPDDLPRLPPPWQEEHVEHLKIILKLLKKEKFYAKFLKYDFWLESVQFLGHVINSEGVHVDPAKIEAIKNWVAPKTPTELRKNKKYEWGKKEDKAFQLLEHKLSCTPILALPNGTEDFVVYCDVSLKGYRVVLMQQEKVISYAS
uniref:Putative reverse transcriptase domain-containing protein n=1 Tax=Tanacetum cinerariifolium TaxID=118510 RepID=A0A699H982_TANCI|nr:putative reverse transcriptase domain-containing protein [Tanacetum cinerariifolium]